MTTTLDVLMEASEKRPGATDSEIASVERDIGQPLPDDYKLVLHRSNGFEGFVAPGAYLMLWSTGEIHSLNQAYSVPEFLPGVVLIGTDGGDTGYGFRCDDGRAQYVGVPLIGMGPGELSTFGATFVEFLNRLGSAT